MSIQSVIDLSLSTEGGELRTITVRNESGDVTVPDLCAVSLMDCKIGSLTVGKNCTVVVLRSEIRTSMVMDGGTLTLEETAILAGATVTLRGVKARQRKCTGEGLLILEQKALLEAVSNDRTGAGGTAITARDSRVEISNDTFTSFNECLLLDQGSRATVRGSTLTGLLCGLILRGASEAEIYECEIRGDGDTAVVVDGFSKLRVSSLTADLYGAKGALVVSDNSKAEVHNARDLGAVENIIQVTKSSRLEMNSFGNLRTTTGTAVRCSDSEARFRAGGEFRTDRQVCISLRNSALYCQEVERIVSDSTHAIRSQGGCTVRLIDFSKEVISRGATCIEGGSGDTYEVINVPRVKGDHGDAFKLGGGSTVHAQNMTEIIGTVIVARHEEIVAHAFNVGDNCSIRLQDIPLVRGVVFAGINAGSNLALTAVNVGTIQGTFARAIEAKSGATIRAKDTNNFLAGDGGEYEAILLGSGSDVHIEGFSKIESPMWSAIVAPSSKIVLLEGGEVLASPDVPCDAIAVEGSGGEVDIRGIDKIEALDGRGIHVSVGKMRVRDVQNLIGAFRGISAVGTEAQVSGIGNLFGEHAVAALSGSRVVVSGCKISTILECLLADGSEIRASGCSLEGGPLSIKVDNRGTVIGSSLTGEGNVEAFGGAQDADASTVILRSSVVVDVIVQKSVIKFEGVTCGDISLDDSSLSFNKGLCGDVVVLNSGAILVAVVGGEVSVDTGGALLSGGAWSAVVSNGGLVSAMETTLSPDLTAGGLVSAGKTELELAHDVKIEIESADIETKLLV